MTQDRELYWFPFFVKDWLSSPARMRMLPEQRGAYFDLLAIAWGNGEQEPSLPADDATLAALSGLGRRWGKLGALVRAQFTERDGSLYNAKLSAVWIEQQRKHDKAVERGRLGRAVRDAKLAEKQKNDSSQTSSLAKADLVDGVQQSEPEPEPETTQQHVAAGAAKRARQRAAPREEPPLFAIAWSFYPRRAGSNPRTEALSQWLARIRDGDSEAEMVAGAERYKAFCDATQKTGTEVVMQARRFFGRNREFAEPWDVPKLAQSRREESDWERQQREGRELAERQRIAGLVSARRARGDGEEWWQTMQRRAGVTNLGEVLKYASQHIEESAA